MMKKLLMLMLVLGLASAANAVIVGSYTLQVSPTGVVGSYVEGVDSEVTLNPSQNLWIGVHNSVNGQGIPGGQMATVVLGIAVPSGIIGYDEETGDPIYGQTGPADTVWTGNWQMYQPPLTPTPPPPTPFGNTYLGVGGAGGALVLDMWMLILTDGNPVGFNGVGVLDAKELHCVGPESDDVIYLVDASDGSILDTLVIHQTGIPEPMTITLLALGGLLLRRRK